MLHVAAGWLGDGRWVRWVAGRKASAVGWLGGGAAEWWEWE